MLSTIWTFQNDKFNDEDKHRFVQPNITNGSETEASSD